MKEGLEGCENDIKEKCSEKSKGYKQELCNKLADKNATNSSSSYHVRDRKHYILTLEMLALEKCD